MSAVIGALRADLSASWAQFQEDMGKAAGAVRKFATEAEKQGAKIARVGNKLSLALTAPLVAFGIKSVQASNEAAKAFAQVEAALASAGNRSGKTAEELKKSAKALETLSTFDDDEILVKTTANLLKFGNITGEVFDRAQLAIVNMSARMGEDLESATIKVGRALQDPIAGINALTRSGVSFTTQQKEQIKALVTSGRGIEAQGLILKQLEIAYGGAAKASRDASPTAAMAQQWRDLSEIVGALLTEILKPLIEVLKSVAEWFKGLSPEMQKIVVIGGLAVAALGPLLSIMGNLIVVVGSILKVLPALIAGFTAVSAATWGWLAAIVATVAGAAALFFLLKELPKLIRGDFTAAWEDAKKTAVTMWSDLQKIFSTQPLKPVIQFTPEGTAKFKHGAGKAGPPAAPIFNQGPEVLNARKTFESDIRQMGAKISQAFDTAALPKSTAAANALNDQIDEFIKKAQVAGLNTGAWTKELDGLRGRIENLRQFGLAKEAEKFARAVAEDGIAVNRFASGSLDPLNEKLATVDDAYLALKDKIEAQIEDNKILANSNDAAAEAMKRLKEGLADLEDAHAAATEAAIAQWNAENRIADLQSAANNVRAGRDIQDLAQASGRAGLMTPRELQLQQITRDLQDKSIEAQQRLADLEAKREEAQRVGDEQAIERLTSEMDVQAQLLDLVSATSAEQIQAAQKLEDAFANFTDSVESDLLNMLESWDGSIKGLEQTFKKMLIDLAVKPHVEAANDALKGLFKTAISTIFGGGGGFGGSSGGGAASGGGDISSGDVPGHARGGFIPPGEWGMTGEHGPEPVFGGRTGVTVRPNESLGKNVTQIFNIQTPDANSFRKSQRQIAREMKLGLA